MAMSTLDALKTKSKVVADTGDFSLIERFRPLDATTNPSLILKAATDEKYNFVIDEAFQKCPVGDFADEDRVDRLINQLSVGFGCQILKHIPGRVSTEVAAKHSFDIQKTISCAQELIAMYREAGIDSSRVLIKIAATWEGIMAAKELEQQGIHTNLTLIFSTTQAVACGEFGITLISPFVGRITDWYNQNGDVTVGQDPGVQSVIDIFNYFKCFHYSTEIMAASFRNVSQIKALAGCDLITISPPLLEQLNDDTELLVDSLDETKARSLKLTRENVSESEFRWNLTNNAMAIEKLAEGIRKFHIDYEKLIQVLASSRKSET